MQDLLVYVTRGLAAVTTALRAQGKRVSPEVSHLVTWNLFTTITNANFDEAAITQRVAGDPEGPGQPAVPGGGPCGASPRRPGGMVPVIGRPRPDGGRALHPG